MKIKILFLLGFILWLYPILGGQFEGHRKQKVLLSYEQVVENLETNQVEADMQNAREYNERLYEIKSAVGTEFQDYRSQLNPTKNGMMGSISIPKLSICFPIYHGTKEEELSKGIGHIPGSSLPVGGVNTHALLVGHRGLPKVELFQHLDEMEIGDLFYLYVYDRKLSYRVIQMDVVRPTEFQGLELQEGRDLVSLITCTPYGINTHRLIVTGEREDIHEG